MPSRGHSLAPRALAIAVAVSSMFISESSHAQDLSDMRPNTLPRRIAGFVFGGNERRARAACERAGHKWKVEWKSSHGGGPRSCVGGAAQPWYSSVIRTDMFFCGAHGTKLCDLTLHLRTSKGQIVLRKLARVLNHPGVSSKNGELITFVVWRFLPYKDSEDWPYRVQFDGSGDSSRADGYKARTIQVRFVSPRHDDG